LSQVHQHSKGAFIFMLVQFFALLVQLGQVHFFVLLVYLRQVHFFALLVHLIQVYFLLCWCT